MHTLDIPNARARIFHNGDWSGDVEVLLGVNPIGHPDQDAPPSARLRIPAAVFAAVAVKMLEEAGSDPQTDAVKASPDAGEPWPDPPPCPSAWWIHGPLWGQPCVEKGPHTKHRTALVNGHTGEWTDRIGEIVPRVETVDPAEPTPWPSPALVEALYQLKIALVTADQREAMRNVERIVYAERTRPA